MVDKIHGFGATPLRRHDAGRAEAHTTGKPATAPAAGASAGSVSSVRGDSLLARASQAMADTPEIDQKKVDDIKAAISRGEFKVDAQAVARAFLDMERAG